MEIINVFLALMSFLAVALAGQDRACKEGSLKCDGGSPGGAVFVCNDGVWIVLMACRSYENCVKKPVPHCTWASADAGSADSDPVPGFEGLPAEVSAAADDLKNATVADTVESSTAANNGSPNWNVCTPCMRHNDNCRQSCTFQGDECDIACGWKTSSVNLTTGDLRQPTVSCGDFCKWPYQ
ncbi:uncharacterized protein EKO05_0000146 [Ascochyta rabiei]|uniref:Uncharacterized protein n=1 Tax=Didymella rabiei TaxID=5454 RepID=A0A163K4M9_DIDRA|nr:uncharacterized protein EKO05_0000146 [Ascochyta rabiei]KZM26769.1 hypothetical protein ST47_g2093 [Ascochyta rabiei]UPX09457.1 hypothetical protein EKO05_0000146 [Ascochyta rabiei]